MAAVFLGAALSVSPVARAGDLDLASTGVVFTFPGAASATLAADVIEAQGARGTFYVESDHLRDGPYYTAFVSAQEVAALAARGHEIGSATASFRDLTTLDDATLHTELSGSRARLEAITGRSVSHLAYPYGAADARVVAAASAVYVTGRMLAPSLDTFSLPHDAMQAPALVVTRDTSLAQAKSYVDFAASRGVTVILVFGAITPAPGPWDWTPSDLSALASHARASGIPSRSMSALAGSSPPPPAPPPPPPPGTPRVVFSFDDGWRGQLGAARTLEEHDFRGTFFIVSSWLRQGKAYDAFVSAREVAGLSRKGHEIAAHGATHLDLTTLSATALAYELDVSQQKLAAIASAPIRSFAYPYGATNPVVDAAVALRFDTGRLYEQNEATADFREPYHLRAAGVTAATSLADAKGYVDLARAQGATVILVFHDLRDSPRAYDWRPSDFRALVAYVDAVGVEVVTLEEATTLARAAAP